MKLKGQESFCLFYAKYKELTNMKNSCGTINLKNHSFKVNLKLKPTKGSRYYRVGINYKINEYPTVWVYGLDMLDYQIPHHYDIDKSKNRVELCLYKPGYYEFDNTLLFSKNVIPWTCEWLYFYEIYLITGNWYGNGEHPKGDFKY